MMNETKLVEVLRVMKKDLSQRKNEREDKRTMWLDGLYDAVAAVHELLVYNSLYIANSLFSKDTIDKIESIMERESR